MPAVTNRVPPPLVPSMNTRIVGSRLVTPLPLCVVGPEVTGDVDAVRELGGQGVPGTDFYRQYLTLLLLRVSVLFAAFWSFEEGMFRTGIGG